MKEKITGIVLTSLRHSDRHNVTTLYTRERGRMALLTPAGTSRQSRQTAACFQPLNVVEALVSINPNKELHVPASTARTAVWRTICHHPVKMTIAMLLSEFLNRLLNDAPPEPPLWDFIFGSVSLLDSLEDPAAIANFHIAFLIGMTRMTGIFPDLSGYAPGMEFDMKSGRMVLPFSMQGAQKGLRIDAERAAFIPAIARMNYANCHRFRFNGHERSEILEDILRYFGCHFPGADRLKSLDVLKEVFA